MISMSAVLAGMLLCAAPFAGHAEPPSTLCDAVDPGSDDSADLAIVMQRAECLGVLSREAMSAQQRYLAKAREILSLREQDEARPSRTHGLVAPIASDTDLAESTRKVGHKPKSAKPDTHGAFRTFCMTSHFAQVDPIVFPGRARAGHLHRFMGNTLTDENSDYESLRSGGGSSCYGGAAYRTALWAPVLFDQDGMVVDPDYTGIYYKRPPKGSEECRAMGRKCVDLPAGLRIIYGTNYTIGDRQSANVRFDCGGRDIAPTIAEAATDCLPGQQLRASIRGPECWDGRRTDSPDHQSHLAYPARDKHTGALKCPSSHPYVIPTVTYFEMVTLRSGDDPSKWFYSSDRMAETAGGRTFHSDYMEAIEPEIRERFHRHCIDRLLSCVDGELGDGTKLGRPDGFTLTPKPRLTLDQALAYRANR